MLTLIIWKNFSQPIEAPRENYDGPSVFGVEDVWKYKSVTFDKGQTMTLTPGTYMFS